MAAMNSYTALKLFGDSTTDEKAKDIYNQWAKNYDKDAHTHGYIAYKSGTMVLDEHLKKCLGDKRFGIRILDAGAGTGFVGEVLKDLGYTNVDGLDISKQMLDIARDRGIYKNLICAGISDQRINEIGDSEYDATISCATITVGHVKPCGLKEILRHVKQGGLICFTLRQDAYDVSSFGYKLLMDEMENEKKWELVYKQLITYHTDTSDRPELTNCYLFIFKVTRE